MTVLDHNRKFYLTGYPDIYDHYGDIRGRLQLLPDSKNCPIRQAKQSKSSMEDAEQKASEILKKLKARTDRAIQE